jgi:eukaryotic translation initiation factor 2C
MWSVCLSVRLAYPDLPCLNVGSLKKPNFLPPEVCKVLPGQPYKKLNDRQVAAMIKVAGQVMRSNPKP